MPVNLEDVIDSLNKLKNEFTSFVADQSFVPHPSYYLLSYYTRQLEKALVFKHNLKHINDLRKQAISSDEALLDRLDHDIEELDNKIEFQINKYNDAIESQHSAHSKVKEKKDRTQLKPQDTTVEQTSSSQYGFFSDAKTIAISVGLVGAAAAFAATMMRSNK